MTNPWLNRLFIILPPHFAVRANRVEKGMNDELKRLLEGGEAALADVFSEHRDRLGRMVKFRLDRRLRTN